jgi:hypothetical protein
VNALGSKSTSKEATQVTLSSGVMLISKASGLHVPPWQMVSSLLDGEPLRVATWWANPEIPSTTSSTAIDCWDASLKTKPGAVQIAITGTWQGNEIGLKGTAAPSGNLAKIGIDRHALLCHFRRYEPARLAHKLRQQSKWSGRPFLRC